MEPKFTNDELVDREEQIKMFNTPPPARGKERAEFFMSAAIIGIKSPNDAIRVGKKLVVGYERRFYRAKREYMKNERWKQRYGSYPKGVK